MDFITHVSIDDLLYVEEFEELCNILGINLNSEWLEKKYASIIPGRGNSVVFYSQDKKSFIYIDMYQSPTDQHDMIEFGIRVSQNTEKSAYDLFKTIHANAIVKSCIKKGEGILEDLVNIYEYPKILPTITTDENNKIIYKYSKQLEEY